MANIPVGAEFAKFWSRVHIGPETECWVWTAGRHVHGYGTMRINKKDTNAHRASWEMMRGEIPEGLHCLHKCDNPSFCNPDHLFLGTHHENMSDRAAKNRTHRMDGTPRSNHRLTADQVQKVRSLYANSNLGCKEVAAEFGVTTNAIVVLIRGDTWTHVPWPSEEIRIAAQAKAKSRFRMGKNKLRMEAQHGQ